MDFSHALLVLRLHSVVLTEDGSCQRVSLQIRRRRLDVSRASPPAGHEVLSFETVAFSGHF
jgi:hypothetical protein